MKTTWKLERSIPLLFLLVTILAYGLLLPLIGFYWDDWPFAWMAKFLGPQEFIPAFAGVRPFLGPIFFVTTSLLPPVPLYWQIFALLIRFLAGLSAWFALSNIWPQHKRQTLVASLLFLVSPGYSQQWVAFTHINQEWIPFIFYLLSFGFTARSARNRHVVARRALSPTKQSPHSKRNAVTEESTHPRTDTILALLLLIAGLFPTEYFISIEPLRFFFIWVILSEKIDGWKQRLAESFKCWLPYLLIWLANGVWLAYFYTMGGYASYEVEVVTEPVSILGIFSTAAEALWKAGFYVWLQILLLAARAVTAPTTLLTLALIVVAFLALSYYLRGLDLPEGEPGSFAVPALLIGLAGILLGRIPSFAAGLPLTLQSSYDRFMISMMLGASLFTAGLLELLVRNPRTKTYVFASLIALGIGQQFFNANIFRRDWAKQQEIYWQLAWRIPALKPGTAILTHQLPIDYETDLSFTAPINWMYAPDYTRSSPMDKRSGPVDERSGPVDERSGPVDERSGPVDERSSPVDKRSSPVDKRSRSADQSGNLPYALLYTEKRLGGTALPSLNPNTEISLPIRRVSFHGSTSQVLVIYMPPNGCLRVLDPARGDQITYERQSRFLVDAIPLSDLSNILVTEEQTARLPFLKEPAHTWCYYFSKAELARQVDDWTRVVSLIDEARSQGYKPEDPFEWLTYIEAQARTGNIDAAQELSNSVRMQENGIRKGLCELWKRVQATTADGSSEKTRVDQILSDLQCPR